MLYHHVASNEIKSSPLKRKFFQVTGNATNPRLIPQRRDINIGSNDYFGFIEKFLLDRLAAPEPCRYERMTTASVELAHSRPEILPQHSYIEVLFVLFCFGMRSQLIDVVLHSSFLLPYGNFPLTHEVPAPAER